MTEASLELYEGYKTKKPTDTGIPYILHHRYDTFSALFCTLGCNDKTWNSAAYLVKRFFTTLCAPHEMRKVLMYAQVCERNPNPCLNCVLENAYTNRALKSLTSLVDKV